MKSEDSPALMLGRDWEGDNPAGWFVTEKLEGVRCYWDGSNAWSKDGNPIQLPARILKHMPDTPLDGEIFAGRGRFEIARSAVQYDRWTPDVGFHAFDKPDAPGNWLDRIQAVANTYSGHRMICHVCKSHAHLMDTLREVQLFGGEGLMIYSPLQTRYEPGRTSRLLKVKLVLPLLS